LSASCLCVAVLSVHGHDSQVRSPRNHGRRGQVLQLGTPAGGRGIGRQFLSGGRGDPRPEGTRSRISYYLKKWLLHASCPKSLRRVSRGWLRARFQISMHSILDASPSFSFLLRLLQARG
jgi:hypothetical protein